MSRRRLTAAVVSIVVVVGVLVGAGVLGTPSAGVKDEGDWGEVTEEETTVVTTLWVNNPNPIGVSASNLQANYQIEMNGITMAHGEKDGISIESGNNTKRLRTTIDNEKLQPWWVEYVERNETITVEISGKLTVGSPMGSTTVEFPSERRRLLEDETPVISALNDSVSEWEGTYTKDTTVAGQQVSVGYEIREATAQWESVNESSTVVLFTIQVHNPGDVPVPAVPEGLRAEVIMNDIAMFDGGMDAATPRNVAEDRLIEPGQTQTVELAVRMDNDKIDDWFRSHVKNDEFTEMEVRTSVLFRSERTDLSFRIPPSGPSTVNCDLQTAILIDDQETRTDCTPGN